MAENPLKAPRQWPEAKAEDDDMYVIVDERSGEAVYLVYSSVDKGRTYIRDNRAWFPVNEQFFDEVDDPDYYNIDVDVDIISRFDELAEQDKPMKISDVSKKAVTAAAFECPPATKDIALNLKNRKNAIDTAMYGPFNPAEANRGYWKKLADEWSVPVEQAKRQRCGNCAVFIISPQMKDCIKSGLVEGARADEFDLIDEAGELGYCEAFDFKCASARTCRAWVGGGPITDDIK
jgi:hypothetical protein